jgi:hypothetical protein
MQPDLPYFATPARTERLQLLLHLARNAIDPVYLRAPLGGGKRRLLEELTDQLGDEVARVTLDAQEPVRPVASFLRQLDLPPDAADSWPSGLLDALGDRQVLVVVLHADAMDDMLREPLAALRGSGVRMLLAGEGGGVAGWAVQFVDLPPFDRVETAAFLRQSAGPAASRVTDEAVEAAFAATQGWPGELLEVLEGLLGTPRPGVEPLPDAGMSGDAPADRPGDRPVPASRAEVSGSTPKRRDVQAPQPMNAEKVLRQAVPVWAWVGGGVLAVVLLAVLIFQDAINTLLEPPPVVIEQPVALPELTEADPALPQPETPAAAPVPPISLPELEVSPGSTEQADEAAVAEAVESLMPPLDRLETVPQPAAEAPEVSKAEPDPLDLVMQDAIAAQRQAGSDALDPSANADRPVPPRPPSPPVVEAPPQPKLQEATEAQSGAEGEVAVEGPPSVESSPVAQVPERPAPPQVPAREQAAPAAQAAPAPVVEARRPERQTEKASSGAGEGMVAQDPPLREESAPADPAQRVPAPVEDRSTFAPTAAVVPDAPVEKQGPAPVEERGTPAGGVRLAKAEPAVPDSDAAGGEAWLRSRPANRYTLQLVGARDRASVEKFAQVHNISQPFAIFVRELNGSDWFSLVAGDYPDRDAAIAARARLPKALSDAGIWPRTFGSIVSPP